MIWMFTRNYDDSGSGDNLTDPGSRRAQLSLTVTVIWAAADSVADSTESAFF
jgi:hypothetical protein